MTSGFRRHRTVGVSVVAHLAALAVIAFHNPRVIDLKPEWLAYGDGAHTYKLIYFPLGAGNDATPPDAAKLQFPPQASKPRPRLLPKAQPPKAVPEPQQVSADAETGDHNSRAGSPLGTLI